jgi:hypothetical protein
MLTAMDIKALRQAQTVSFHAGTPGDNGHAVIRATKRVAQPGPFGDGERHYEIQVATRVASFINNDSEPRVCFAMIHSSQYEDVWRTTVSMLRPGDELELNWKEDACCNGYMKESSGSASDSGPFEVLHGDVLELRVKRGKRELTFYVDHSICPDNTARMIRRR